MIAALNKQEPPLIIADNSAGCIFHDHGYLLEFHPG
jgi:hypothetical protein